MANASANPEKGKRTIVVEGTQPVEIIIRKPDGSERVFNLKNVVRVTLVDTRPRFGFNVSVDSVDRAKLAAATD